MEWASFTGDFEGKVNYYGTSRRKLWKLVSFYVGSLLGSLQGCIYWEF